MFYKKIFAAAIGFALTCCAREQLINPTVRNNIIGQTNVAKWHEGKQCAVSIAYDGGTANQFKAALPIMDSLKIPATFFIVTGDIADSQYKGMFIGRPVSEILKESETEPVNEQNFFQRAGAVRYLGYEGMEDYHTRAGDLFEQGKIDEAYKQIDEAYAKARQGGLKEAPTPATHDNETAVISWEEIKKIAERGHEFASLSVSHPHFAIIDDINMDYEILKSREEILNHLGIKHTFSHECPYGSENKRAVERALPIYPALLNRMPEPFLEEINRRNIKDPTASQKEYVQWQREPKDNTAAEEMKQWIDVCLTRDNIWLVPVFRGAGGIGSEPQEGAGLREFFDYLKSKESSLWIATFQDVVKYMRERKNSYAPVYLDKNKIRVELTHTLEPALYNFPLTLKTYVPDNWDIASAKQGDSVQYLKTNRDENGVYVMYQATPNAEPLLLRMEKKSKSK